MRALIREASGYGVASAAAFGVDIGLLTLFAKALGWNHLIAAALSFIAGAVFLYAASVHFVFKVRRVESRALELGYFVALGGAGLCVNLVVIYIAVDNLGIPLLLAKLGAATCTFGVNFLLRRQFLFTRGATE
jgi:putative flippase GtrA